MRAPASPAQVRSDFNRIARLPEEAWDANAHYHDVLLRDLPARLASVLDVGCGTGAFTRHLAARADRVLGLDLAPAMIDVARARAADLPHVAFVQADVMQDPAPGMFDAVVTIATLHHLPLEAALQRLRALVQPGGTLLVLDLRQARGLRERLLDGLAVPVNLALRWRHMGRLRRPRAARAAWEAHGHTDTYPTMAEVQAACRRVLPGAVVTRLLLWRYTIVWRADA